MKEITVNRKSYGSSLVRLIKLLQDIEVEIKANDKSLNNQHINLSDHQVVAKNGEITQV